MKQTTQIRELVGRSSHPTKKIAACGNALSVGEVFTSARVSSYRATAGASDIKITYVAKALDYLLGKNIFLLTGKSEIYIEVKENGKTYKGLVTKETQAWDSANVPTIISLVADVMYCMVHSDNEEIRGSFRRIAANIGKKETAEEIAFFCDSYFYYSRLKSVEITDDLVLDPVKAAYRRGMLTKSFLEKALPMSEESVILEEQQDYAGEETTSRKITPEQVLADAKAGKYTVPYGWKEEQKEYIYSKGLLESFVPTETFVNILNKITFRLGRILKRMNEGADRVTALGQDYINLTLTGKPGTGKTAMIYALSAATGLPVYTTAGSHNTDEDEFEGKTKMVDGHPAAVPTDALKCFEDGGIFLIEEANLPQAAVIMGALGQAVEFPFILKKNGYETIRRHPLCIFITTMNVGTVGAKAMSQPFANRFKQSYVLNDPGSKVFIDILSKRTGESTKLCRWVYNAYTSILKCLDKNDAMADIESIKLALSMRSCMGAIENIQEGQHPKDAIRDSIVGKIAEQDLEMSEICLRAVDSLPDFR